MKKIITSIIFSFFIFYLFISPIKATNSAKFDYVEDIYYVIKLDDYYFSHKQPLIYLDNKLVYCLEPEKKVYEEKEYQLGNINNIALTKEQLKQIELIGYYGYKYDNHTDYKYYLAAQELIWKITRPNIQIYWTNEEYGNDKITLEKEKEEIMYFVNTHYDIPSIDKATLTFTINQETVLNSDEFLRNYEVYDSGPHLVSIKDGKIHVKTNQDYIGKSIIKLRRIKSEESETQIFISDNYQSLIYTNNLDKQEA